MSIPNVSSTPRQRQIGGNAILASDAEVRHMQAGLTAVRHHVNKYGEIDNIIEVEDIVCEAMYESMATTGDYDMLDGDVFYELSSFIAMGWYAGDFGTQHG